MYHIDRVNPALNKTDMVLAFREFFFFEGEKQP